jgi:Clp amino terminal domain, pathogenicity island component
VVLAQEEARMLNHNYIGTEHILLGPIREGEGVAAKALESLGISLEANRLLWTRKWLFHSGNKLLVFRCARSVQDRHQTSAAEGGQLPGATGERMGGPVITGRAHGARSVAYPAEAVGVHPSRGPDPWPGTAAAAGPFLRHLRGSGATFRPGMTGRPRKTGSAMRLTGSARSAPPADPRWRLWGALMGGAFPAGW